uniref:Putative secreted peptide n=1 Tax=Anopheles braziliensis TaxID=58242 RepID=A0A2M3ZXF6_9DIPT
MRPAVGSHSKVFPHFLSFLMRLFWSVNCETTTTRHRFIIEAQHRPKEGKTVGHDIRSRFQSLPLMAH